MQPTRIGPFAIEEPIDGLPDGNVYRGLHVELKLSMAIKLLPASIVNQVMGSSTFPEDVKSLQQLIHPQIVRCHGGAVEQGQPYLALEHVQGESLRSRIDRRGRLPWEMAIDIVDAACDALQYAHSNEFVHQRLTPARILLPEDGGVKLTGFDCAWADRDEVLGLRSPMQVAHYLAPEVFRGKQSASQAQCDLFSLGVILYECLAGKLPWAADSPADLVEARRTTPAPRVATTVLDCPVWLDVLVSRLLEVKRERRLQSAEDVHRALVDAKQKVASGMGAAQHAWSGRQGTLTVDKDRSEVRQIRKRGSKERDESPFYEQAWFLAICLLAVIGFGAWVLSPPSEDALFTKAKPLMESESKSDWRRAEEQYLGPLRERFPDTKYAAEIQAFDDRFAMHRAETRVMVNERLNRRPASESERQYGEAWRFEQMGDRLTAWQKYDALVSLFLKSESADDQAYVRLAQRQIGEIKADQGDADTQAGFVQKQLDRAKALVAAGDLIQARKVLDSIISLYEGNRELKPLLDRAREQMRQIDGG